MKFLLPALFFLVSLQCYAQRDISINGKPVSDECFEVITTTLPDTLTTDPFEIEKVELEQDCLTLEVRFGCGCGEVNFSLVHYKNDKVYPSKIHLYLMLSDKDLCKALCREKLTFDLSFLKALEGNKDLKLFIDNSSTVLYKTR